MPHNVEVKIKLPDLAAVLSAVRALGAEDRGVLQQVDTYFQAPKGARLKLREQEPGGAQLVAYERPDINGLRTCNYRLFSVADPVGLKETLALGLGVLRRVVKARRLFMLGRTRIHLDQVEGLGDFLELEVVLRDGEPPAHGEVEARDILQRLGLADAPRIAGSYLDQ
ncbi:MAG: class IV adenylate cyclase [Planctomycetota bacterium]|nr:class IV adenylate cyclase [Planctomycetota bacterium]